MESWNGWRKYEQYGAKIIVDSRGCAGAHSKRCDMDGFDFLEPAEH